MDVQFHQIIGKFYKIGCKKFDSRLESNPDKKDLQRATVKVFLYVTKIKLQNKIRIVIPIRILFCFYYHPTPISWFQKYFLLNNRSIVDNNFSPVVRKIFNRFQMNWIVLISVVIFYIVKNDS